MTKNNASSDDSLILTVGGNVVRISFTDRFNDNIDADTYMKTDTTDILGEMITFPVLMNRVGTLRADANNDMEAAKFSMNIKKAELSEKYRNDNSYLKDASYGRAGTKTLVKPVESEIDNNVMLDTEYQVLYRNYLTAKKTYEIIDSLYWSANAKNKKLDVLSIKLLPQEFEADMIERAINGIQIRFNKTRYK